MFYPKVSIIIPVYNGSNFLSEAIDSALSQTYKNTEIIVVNDGSNDEGATEKIALSYGDKIRYFSKENGGVASALNLAISKMSGEYFSWLSHDDLYYENKIKSQINKLIEIQNFDTIVYSGYNVINSDSKLLYSVNSPDKVPQEKRSISLYPLLRGLIHGCSLLIPLKYFHEIGLFNEKLLSTQDYELWFKFLRKAPIIYDENITLMSRVHPDQSTHKISNVLEEANELWMGFLKELTGKEMIEIEGSVYLFFKRTAEFLSNANYTQASILAEDMAAKTLKNIKISVIIPVYNNIKLAIDAIRSVIDQTHQNFEIIVVNNGSTENVDALIENCALDKRINYYSINERGVSKARNFGITKALGDYIAFLDADDLFYSNKLELQLKAMENNLAFFSHTSYKRIDFTGQELEIINSGAILNDIAFPQIVARCQIATPTVMGKTFLFKENLFPENINSGEDNCLWISIASKYRICGIDTVLSKVRVTGSSTYSDPRKLSTGLINIAAFVVNNKDLSKFSPWTISLLKDAINNLKVLEKPLINNVSSNPKNLIESYYSIIRSTINSLMNDGLLITLSRIYSKIKIIFSRNKT